MLRSKISLGTSSSLAFSNIVARAVFDAGFGPPLFKLHQYFRTRKINGSINNNATEITEDRALNTKKGKATNIRLTQTQVPFQSSSTTLPSLHLSPPALPLWQRSKLTHTHTTS